jgi:hypothetical protein
MRQPSHGHHNLVTACLVGALTVANVHALSVSFTNERELFLSLGTNAKPVGDGPFEFTNSLNFTNGNLNVYVAKLTMSGNDYVVRYRLNLSRSCVHAVGG